MPAEEVLDAIEPFERLYEPELDKLEIEEDYPRVEELRQQDLPYGWYFDDLEPDCGT